MELLVKEEGNDLRHKGLFFIQPERLKNWEGQDDSAKPDCAEAQVWKISAPS